MARKVIDIIYNFVRKRLAQQQPTGIVTRLPESAQIEQGMKEIFRNLKEGGLSPVSADKLIKTEDDLLRTISEINQKKIERAEAMQKADAGITRVFDKIKRKIPLNADDEAALKASGFKTELDKFQGFQPKVIQGGKTLDMSKYSNKMLNDLAEEGNKLQKELAQLDRTGSSKLPYREFQSKSRRLDEINEILTEAQKMPMDFFPDDFARGKDLTMKTPGGEIPYIESPTQTIIQGGKRVPVKIPKNVKQDVLDSYDNVMITGNDTKYDADVLATDLAERRGFIKEGQDATDMDQKKYSDLYGEAYNFLTQSRFLNKPPRKPKAKGGLMSAVKKLQKKFGKDIIQKGKAPKRNEKKKLQDLFREFNRKNKAGGGVAHMLGEPREEMAAGGIPLRRLLQFLHQGMDKPQKASEGLKKMKLPKQMKFFAEKQGFNPDQIKIDYLENVLDGLKKDRDLIKSVEPSPTKNELENMASGAFRESFVDTTQGGRFKGLDSEMIESSIMELETIIKNLKTKGQGRKLNAEGGRIGFADGGMSRRTFLKIMAALAAFPVVGKLAKTTKIAKSAKPIITPTSEMPAHFPKLVEKIIKEGQVVKKDFVKKTGDVTTYKHPDRPDIELTIEGDGQRIQLDFDTDQGMKGGYEFKKGIPDETVRKPPDEFEAGEVKYRFSQDGESYSKDFELGIDTGTENLDEFAGVGKQKTSKSKVNLPESDDYADGGLAGLLGE